MHRAAHRLVAAEREAEVRKAARDVRARAAAPNFSGSFDEVDGVAAMLVDAGRNGKDVGVEDDVAGVGAVGDKQPVRPLANLDLALLRVGLSDFVERHDDHGGAV